MVLRTKFKNLRDVEDWRTLFDHLSQRTGWMEKEQSTSDQLLKEVFGGELVNATVLLFQSMSKIRFGFLDGQARMMALYHFSRKVYPGLDHVHALSNAVSVDDLKKCWSLSNTGNLALCTIIQRQKTNQDNVVSKESVKHLNELSKRLLDRLLLRYGHLKSVTPSNLSDCIGQLKYVMIEWKSTEIPGENNQERRLRDLSLNMREIFMIILKQLVSYDKVVAGNLFGLDRLKQHAELAEHEFLRLVYEGRFPTAPKLIKVLFPALGSRKTGISLELLVLMILLGCAAIDKESMQCLDCCINKQWIVPVVDKDQVGGIAISDLHLGTFVNDSIPETWYYSKLFKVSLKIKCGNASGFTHVSLLLGYKTQGLVPSEIKEDTKSNPRERFDQYFITTFYALTWSLTKLFVEHLKKSAVDEKQEAVHVVFVAISHVLLKIFAEHGMVMAVPVCMEQTMPELYKLIVPSDADEDLKLYNHVAWAVRSDVQKPASQIKGWSNIPILLFVIGLFIEKHNAIIKLNSEGIEFRTYSSIDSFESYAPTFTIGEWLDDDSEKIEKGLYDLMLFLLYDVSKIENQSQLYTIIRNNVNRMLWCATKKHIFSCIQNSFGAPWATYSPEEVGKNPYNVQLEEKNEKSDEDEGGIPVTASNDEDSVSKLLYSEADPNQVLEAKAREQDTQMQDVSGGGPNEANKGDEQKEEDEKDEEEEDEEEEDDDEEDEDDDEDDEEDGDSFNDPDYGSKKRKKKHVQGPPRRKKRASAAAAAKQTQGRKGQGTTRKKSSQVQTRVELTNETKELPKVKKVYSNLPPPLIESRDTPWYWQMCDAEVQDDWDTLLLSTNDVKKRQVLNVHRLAFTWIALKYCRKKGLTEGDLFGILAKPTLLTDEEDIAKWNKRLETLHSRCERIISGQSHVLGELSSVAGMDESTDFEQFYNLVMSTGYPLSGTVEKEAEKTTTIDMITTHCWKRQYVRHEGYLTLKYVLLNMHNWKSQLLFDKMILEYFHDEEQYRGRTDAAFNSTGNIRVYPTDMEATRRKLEWEEVFNSVVFHTKQFQLKVKPFQALKRGFSFLNFIEIQTEEVLKACYVQKQLSIPAITEESTGETMARDICRDAGPLDETKLANLWRLFFGNSGKLRRELRSNIDFGVKRHGLIMFGGLVVKDVRWFIPFKKIHPDFGGKLPTCWL